MNYQFKKQALKQLSGQRNNALLIVLGLFVLNVIQLFIIAHLANNEEEHFKPLPPVMTQPFSIGRNHVSASYLAQMTRYFTVLRLNYTPATLPEQAKLLLQYVDPQYYDLFKNELNHELKIAKANVVSMSFAPTQSTVNLKNLSVTIHGVLTRYVGKEALPQEPITWQVTYSYKDGVLAVTSMTPIQTKKTSTQQDDTHA